ncbi:MAG: TRAP transporter substrate-binding protein [Pseudomonadota bacterium]
MKQKLRIRPRFFAALVITAILVLPLMPSPALSDTIKLTYANFPPASTFPCVQMERWAKEVKDKTNGKVEIQTFPGGTLLPAKNIFDGVISGSADIGNFAMSYQPGRFPVSEAVDLPLGFSSARAASMVLYDLIDKYTPKEFEKVKIITLFTCPPANIMTKDPVTSLAGLKGLELRAGGTQADIVKNLGGIPIAMPQSDTPEALQKGTVKGNVSSIEVLKDFNYAAYTPNVTMANLWVVSFAVVMNKDKWNSLPEDVKKVMDALSREQMKWTADYVDSHVTEAVNWAKEKYNLQIHTLPPAESAQIPKLLQPIIDGYAKRLTEQGLPGDQIVTDALALKAKYDTPMK